MAPGAVTAVRPVGGPTEVPAFDVPANVAGRLRCPAWGVSG